MKGWLFSWILLLTLSFPVQAQSGATTGTISGSVKDSQGAVLVGATVTAQNSTTNLARSAQVGSDGLFHLVQLPPGKYQVSAQAEGFATVSETIRLNIGTVPTIEFTLSVQRASEAIEVLGSSIINEEKTENSTNIDRQRIENLPINRRNFLDFSLTTARVTIDRLPIQGVLATSGLSINGQTARSNNVTIDGLDNNDIGSGSQRSTFSQDAVQEFQVVTDGYSAEFGRAIGGVINIVTRSGENTYHGTLFSLLRNDKVSARDPFVTRKPPYQQYQFGTTLSGPLKQDKAFFFTAFERLTVKQNNIVTIRDETVAAARRQGFNVSNGAIPFPIGTTSVLAKVDWRLSAADMLSLRYNGGFTYNGAFEFFGGLIDKTSGGFQKLDDNSLAFNNIYIAADLKLVNETRLLISRRNQSVRPLDNGPMVVLPVSEGGVLFGRNPLLEQTRAEHIYQFVNNVTFLQGRHQFKFGVDYYYLNAPASKTRLPFNSSGLTFFGPINFAAFTGIPNAPAFTTLEAFDPASRSQQQRDFLVLLTSLLPSTVANFPSNTPLADLSLPLTYLQGFGPTQLMIKGDFLSLFGQDDIRLSPKLLIKAGLRYDLNRVRFIPKNNGNFSPRLALSYYLNRNKSLRLRSSYGLFFDIPLAGPAFVTGLFSNNSYNVTTIPFPFSIIAFAQPGHSFPEADQLPANVRFHPQLSQTIQFQPNFRNGYAQQINIGFDYSIDSNTTILLTYNFVRGIKLLGARDINPIVRPIRQNPLQSALTGRIDPKRGLTIEFESAFDSYYHGLTLSINRRLTNRFGFLANYTLSKTVDNVSDSLITLGNQQNDSLRPGQERGLSLQDTRHRLTFSGSWELSYKDNLLLRNFLVSTIVNIESGRPYNIDSRVDLNMNGNLGDRPLGLGRNVGITPGFASVDLRLTRTAMVQERYRLEAILEIFNLFNRLNISTINNAFPPDRQGNFNLPPQQDGRFIVPRDRYRGAFSPRQLQFGFRLMF
ncbi:MAG: TonB-dependent receptor [Acidobacteriota bacterium]